MPCGADDVSSFSVMHDRHQDAKDNGFLPRFPNSTCRYGFEPSESDRLLNLSVDHKSAAPVRAGPLDDALDHLQSVTQSLTQCSCRIKATAGQGRSYSFHLFHRLLCE